MKPLLMLDPKLPPTIPVPRHPKTGREWKEKRDELRMLFLDVEFAESKEDEESALDVYAKASEDVEWMEVPRIMEQRLVLGSGAWKRAAQAPPPMDAVMRGERRLCVAHPDAWAALTDEERDTFELFTPPTQ